MNDSRKLSFSSDYMEGAHPAIMKRLMETNMEQTPGYGLDSYSETAKARIRKACGCPQAEVWFLIGGTQVNATVIDAMLHPWEGVLAAETGHIATHEAGAIEFCGHKVLTLAHDHGKITGDQIREYIDIFESDANHEHMVKPGMVYLSHPTEYGTLYSKAELEAISQVCHEKDVRLYLDGARLAYALACPSSDLTLKDISALCDAFYIGGTKCGALFGEAVVFPKPGTVPHFFTIIKQHGALLAKGRISGIQFDTLFTDDLYLRIGKPAILAADRIRQALEDYGYRLYFRTPTNQIFVVLTHDQNNRLSQVVDMGFWENVKLDGRDYTVMRIATSWATQDEDVDQLIGNLEKYKA